MSANFSPEMEGYSGIRPFRFWCQKVLPLVYDDSLSYYEVLCKVVDYLNHTIEDLSVSEQNIEALKSSFDELQEYVNTYFDSLDVQEEIDNKLDEMASDGSLSSLVAPLVAEPVAEWLENNLTPTSPVVDKSLSIANAAADSLVVGNWLRKYNVSFTPTITWESGTISSSGTSADSTRIRSNAYLPVASAHGLRVVPTTNCKVFVWTYTSQSAGSVIGSLVPNGITSATDVEFPANAVYYKLCMGYVDDSEISVDVTKPTITRYDIVDNTLSLANKAADAAKTGEVRDVAKGVAYSIDTIGEIDASNPSLWVKGGINQTSGALITGTILIRSVPFPIVEGATMIFDGVARAEGETYARVRFFYYYSDTAYLGRNSTGIPLSGTKYVRFTYGFNSSEGQTVDGYGFNNLVNDFHITMSSKDRNEKALNILVLGNSFSQDAFAYVPPIMKSACRGRKVNIGVAYLDSADIQDHIDLYENEGKYNCFNYWNGDTNKWEYYIQGTSTDNRKTSEDVLTWCDWDIVYIQPAGKVYDSTWSEDDREDAYRENFYAPASELGQLIGAHCHNFTYVAGEWLPTRTLVDGNYDNGEFVLPYINDVLEGMKLYSGISYYTPVGTAFQNARTVPALQGLGSAEFHNLIYSDGVHMQSGLPVLIASYTIAEKFCRMCGIGGGIWGDTFNPTDANCEAIGAYNSNPPPSRMTHGASVGVSSDNITLAKIAAIAAVNNAGNITDI